MEILWNFALTNPRNVQNQITPTFPTFLVLKIKEGG